MIPVDLRERIGKRASKQTPSTKHPAEARKLAGPIITRWKPIVAADDQVAARRRDATPAH